MTLGFQTRLGGTSKWDRQTRSGLTVPFYERGRKKATRNRHFFLAIHPVGPIVWLVLDICNKNVRPTMSTGRSRGGDLRRSPQSLRLLHPTTSKARANIHDTAIVAACSFVFLASGVPSKWKRAQNHDICVATTPRGSKNAGSRPDCAVAEKATQGLRILVSYTSRRLRISSLPAVAAQPRDHDPSMPSRGICVRSRAPRRDRSVIQGSRRFRHRHSRWKNCLRWRAPTPTSSGGGVGDGSIRDTRNH